MAATHPIEDSVEIIPVYSHKHAEQQLEKVGKQAIVYYIKTEAENPYENMFISFRNPGEGIGFLAREDIIYQNGEFYFRSEGFDRISNLLRENPDIPNNIVLKQDIIAAYLNHKNLPWTSTFRLTKGKLYQPTEPWQVYFPTDFNSDGKPSPRSKTDLKVYREVPYEFIKNAKDDFTNYCAVLNAVVGFDVHFSFETTTFTSFLPGEGPNSKDTEHWELAEGDYNNMLDVATSVEVPSLMTLCYDEIRRQTKKSFFQKARDILPDELQESPIFTATPYWIDESESGGCNLS